jgi:4-hydroxy-tetrahydrodipicolinate reductase
MTLNIAIAGAGGRMGRMLMSAVADSDLCTLSGALEYDGSPLVGQDAGFLVGNKTTGVLVSAERADAFSGADVIIDFTLPAATLDNMQAARDMGAAVVLGTTGHSQAQEDVILGFAEAVPMIWAANYSLGVNLLLNLVERASAALPMNFDIDILEMHHREKVDAPSGTALVMGKAAAKGRGQDFDGVKNLSREGQTGKRPSGEIGFATLRGGTVPGEHVVVFAGDDERIEIGHRAGDRHIFARGAVQAATWLAGKQPALYTMNDVLGLND